MKNARWTHAMCLSLLGTMAPAWGCKQSNTSPPPAPAPPSPPAPTPVATTSNDAGRPGAPGSLQRLGQDLAQQGRNAVNGINNALANLGGPRSDAGTEPFAARAARTQPLVPRPVAQTVGGRTVTAQYCTVQGGDILGPSMSSVIEAIELAPDGALYAVDGDHAIRRFRVAPGAECTLVPDAAFGTNGILHLDRDVHQLSLDGRGRLFPSTGVFGSWRVTSAPTPDYYCERPNHGHIAIAGDGATGLGWFPGAPIRRVTYGDAGCVVAPWAYENAFNMVHSIHIEGQRVYVGGSMPTPDNRGLNQVAVYDLNGREQARFGGANATADDGLCWVHSVHPCAAGVCVLDTNCRAIHLWSAQGQHVGNVRAGELLGLRSFWLNDLEVAPRNRVAYIAAGSERAGGTRVYQGLIYRVTGL